MLATSALALLSIQLPAHAAWQTATTASIESNHSSNIQLNPNGKDGAFEHTVEADLVLDNRTENSYAAIAGSVSLTKYQGANDNLRDTDRQYLNVILRKRNRRVTYGFTANVRRDDLLRRTRFNSTAAGGSGDLGGDDIDPTLIDNNNDFDINTLTDQITQTLYRTQLSTTYRLTERNRVGLSYRFVSRNYSNNQSDDPLSPSVLVRDSDRHGIALNFTRELTETSRLQAQVKISQLDTEGREKAQFYETTLRWRNNFSGVSSIEAWLGGTLIDDEEGNNTGYVGGIKGTRRLFSGELSGEISRSLRPSIFGNVTEADLVRIGFSQRINERLRADFNVRATQREQELLLATENSQHVAAGPSLSLRLAQRLNLVVGYEYRWTDRNFQQITGSASAHSGRIALRYLPGLDGRKK